MNKPNRRQLTQKEKLALARNTYGLMARVARKCNVDNSLVSRVLRGINVSKRISTAIDAELDKELRKMERLHERLCSEPKEAAVA